MVVNVVNVKVPDILNSLPRKLQPYRGGLLESYRLVKLFPESYRLVKVVNNEFSARFARLENYLVNKAVPL